MIGSTGPIFDFALPHKRCGWGCARLHGRDKHITTDRRGVIDHPAAAVSGWDANRRRLGWALDALVPRVPRDEGGLDDFRRFFQLHAA